MTGRKQIVLRLIQYAFLIAGCCALIYCVAVVAEARIYQRSARQHMAQAAISQEKEDSLNQLTEGPVPPPAIKSNKIEVGKIEIPRLHISSMVAEGTTPQVLQVAVGHIPGSGVPGQTGNVVLAAHRDSFFRGLGEIKPGDVIMLSLPGEEYEYRVKFTDIVKPNETWILNSNSGETLTLITCYPFHYIGPAPERFIVRADRSGNS